MSSLEYLTPADITAMFYRRRQMLVTTALVMGLLALILAFGVARYRAEAVIEIQQPNIPASITGDRALDTGYGLADRRIREVEQTVTTTESLAKIITENNLYPGSSDTPEQLADTMRRHIGLTFISSNIVNPAAAQKESVEQLSAIAFTLTFRHRDPALAKAGLDALVATFIEQEARSRRVQAKETAAFIDEELKALKRSIGQQQKEIAQFRSKHGESGTTALMMSQQASITNSMNLQQVQNQLSTTQATMGTLRGQLAATDPYLPIVENGEVLHGATSQMRVLKAQLAAISGRYGPEHPDVLKIRDQIAALKKSGAGSSGDFARDADNPVYLQLSQQLTAALAQEKSLQAHVDKLQARQDKYEAEIANNPLVEEEMSKLTLDLDNSKERYRALKERKLAASMKKNLESTAYSARLNILSPATEPTHTSPRRSLVLLLGILCAALGSATLVLLVELTGGTVRNARHLAALIGTAPLITIPSMARGRA